ncbi:MAG: alpha-glycosidase [Candidatus Epulonipiscioides saccharophilum]|nr:MAG: alpha-glycosidase [Epulopiscium sp. AS2M-Bin001]
MDCNGVFHRTSEHMCYPLNVDELIINIKTGYDVEKVYIWYGDPYEYGIMGGEAKWKGKKQYIPFKKNLATQIWWTTTLTPEFKRCKYYFELHTKSGEIWYYFEDGLLSQEEMERDKKILQCFFMPWMNIIDIQATPDWVNETIWYQIFPDRFYNDKNPLKTTPWREEGKVTNKEIFGGNISGIQKKLDYLQDLGITGIYFTPLMEAESIHKYDTTDYTKIDPCFGSNEEFKELVNQAHEKGIKIMIDAVFNHSGRKFKPWLDVIERGHDSKYKDWFMINDWDQVSKRGDTKDGRFYTFAFTDQMPKLNTNNDEVIEYFCKICEFWITEFNIDAIRFDVGNEISHTFLRKLKQRVRKLKPDIYLLGEIWHNAINWLTGEEYDSVMNYPLSTSLSDFFLDDKLTKEDLEHKINRCYTMYMQQTNNVLFNLLDSHDTQRLINICKGNLGQALQQLAILFTMPGSPCIYYGTEVFLEGSYDPDCRRCMPWNKIENLTEYQMRISKVKELIELRKSYKAARSLHYHFQNNYANSRCVEYIRLDENVPNLKIVLNCSKEIVNIVHTDKVLFENGFIDGQLKSDGVVIFKLEK